MSDGQIYIDALHAASVEQGREALRPFVDEVLEILDSTDDYASIRERLLRLYREREEPALLELTERAYVLSQYAGHLQVDQDNGLDGNG